MTSTFDLTVLALVSLLGAAVSSCGLPRPPDPAPFDCQAIDRASERFPDRCPAVGAPDAGPSDGGAP